MDFGIWVEPEMISENSNLYKGHPDWAMKIPGHPHSEGRNQCILDLCNPEVRKYVIEEMTRVFSSGEIRYVKWDMNRNFSDIYSPYLPAAKQGETAHRYVLGLYQIMEELTTRFPKILFEGCSAGGNRFDLGILCYFPQIWPVTIRMPCAVPGFRTVTAMDIPYRYLQHMYHPVQIIRP